MSELVGIKETCSDCKATGNAPIMHYEHCERRSKFDAVDHPRYYNSGKIEVIEFIEDQNLNFNKGNAVKYIARAGKKNPDKTMEDIEKAVWYLKREIELLKAKQDKRDPIRPNEMNS